MNGDLTSFKRYQRLSSYDAGEGKPVVANVQSYFPLRWLIVPVLVLIQLAFLAVFGFLPPSVTLSRDPSATLPPALFWVVAEALATNSSTSDLPPTSRLSASSESFATELCLSAGRVYVYDLPPVFNKELLDNCDDLNPWGSRCSMLENGGFGVRENISRSVVPEDLLESWFATDQFALELIFHGRMLRHPCRTLDPATATAFFVPFYAGLDVGRYLWKSGAVDRDLHCRMLLEWLREQEWWQKSWGHDHFLMLGRITWDFRRSKDEDWGGSFLNMPEMQNVTRLLIERNPWDEMDVAVPYPTSFHPRTDTEVEKWRSHVRDVSRPILFSFAGATRSSFRHDFRAELIRQCLEAPEGKCLSVDCQASHCANNTSATLGPFLSSEFCLQPRGDSFTRRSIFDCMVAGAIPVFFWRRTAYTQYTWHLPSDPDSYSVFIDRRDVQNGTSIERVLSRISQDRIRSMRETILEILPRLIYASPSAGIHRSMDAFDVSVDGVLRRFQQRPTVIGKSRD